MGVMEDIGRSNAMSSVNSVFGKAIEMRHEEDLRGERAYTLGLATEKQGMEREDHDLEMNKKRFEFTRAQEEEANLNFKTDVSTNPVIQGLPPEVRADALKWGKEQGYWDDKNIGSRRNQKRAYEQLKENKEVFNRFMWPTTQAHKNRLEAAQEELAVMMEKPAPDEEKIKLQKQKIGGLQKVYDTATDSYSKAQEHFDKQEEADKKRKELKNSRVAADALSPTGYSYYGADEEVVLRGAPPPATQVTKDLGERKAKETARHNVAMEKLRKVNASGDKSTAFIKNVEYAVANFDMPRDEAVKLFSESKPTSRDSFIKTITAKVVGDPYTDAEDKPKAVSDAIAIYDSYKNTPKQKGAPQGKVLDAATATSILKEAGGDANKARELAKQRGYKF